MCHVQVVLGVQNARPCTVEGSEEFSLFVCRLSICLYLSRGYWTNCYQSWNRMKSTVEGVTVVPDIPGGRENGREIHTSTGRD